MSFVPRSGLEDDIHEYRSVDSLKGFRVKPRRCRSGLENFYYLKVVSLIFIASALNLTNYTSQTLAS